MKKLAILLVLVVFAAGCASSAEKSSADLAENQNAPPPFPDESTAGTTADSGTSLPNSDAANPDKDPYSPPPVPAILGLVRE